MAYVGRFDGSESVHASPAMAAVSKQGGCLAETDPSSLPTSTKWSVLSSRIEGIVAELSQVVGKQDAYCVSQSKAEGSAMCAVREKMLSTPWAQEWAEKRTMFSYGEEMSTDPLEAMLLKQLVFLAQPRRVLEIGMFVGYGSTAMLEGSNSAHVVSLEIDPYLKDWLASCLSAHPNITRRHEVVVGPALDSLPKLTGEFDMVFVDANKAEYHRYVELILENNLLSSTGVIICDNILYNGYPYAHSHFDSQPARRGFGDAIREFNAWVCNHPELEQVLLPVRDGVSIIRRRSVSTAAFKDAMVRKGRSPIDLDSFKPDLVSSNVHGSSTAPVAAAYIGRFDGSEATHASPAMAAVGKHEGSVSQADPSALPTCTKWSVLSSRVEGLVAELSEVVGKQDAYCVSQSKAEGPAMRAVREKMLSTPWAKEWAEKRTMFSYGEEMSTDPLEAMLLKQLTFMATPRRVLEIGMFVGYGSAAMLEGSPATQVVSLEIDPYLKGWLSSCLSDYPDLAKRHEVVVGPALDSLPGLKGEFDMVFVDANKAEYHRYVELILEHKLLSPTGVIVCDNVLYNGYPYVPSHFDAQPERRNFGDAICEFNQWVSDHPALEQVVLPIRDGISLIRHRSCEPSTAPSKTNDAIVEKATAPIVEKAPAPAQSLQGNAGPPLSRPSFDVSGGHFIVTGGTQGLGLEIARQLKATGASALVLLSRTRAKGEAAVAELTGGGCIASFVEADMSDPASLETAAAEAIKVLGGRVDGLVNAAGTTERGNLLNTTVEMFNKQFDINTRAPFLLTQAVAKHLIEKGMRGSIVNISSIAAKGGAPFICAYSASKAALNVITTNNAAELAPHGIRVNAVNMGWTLTDNENDLMVKKGGPDWLSQAEPGLPMKRIMRPVDVACTVCFLLSPAAQMMTGNCLDLHPDTALGMLSLKTVDSIDR